MIGSEPLPRALEFIQGERFGTAGMFRLDKFTIPVQTERSGRVDYTAHIFRRENNPQFSHEITNSTKKQITYVSGLDTKGQDGLKTVAQLMEDMPDVEQITLLDHPSTSGVRHERRDISLNEDSFENSAKVISKAMEALLEQGEIKTGQIVVGISTGCAVLEELAALNPKMVDTMVLCAPAGMIDRTEKKIMKGGAYGGGQYIRQFFTDLFRKIPEKMLKPKSGQADVEPVGLVKSIPSELKYMPKEMQKIGVKLSNFMFEVGFKIMRKFPRFYQHFAGMWGDADPHVPIVGADYKKDLALVAKNTTEKAREKITGKKVVLVLGMDDHAVPPMEFLEQVDVDCLSMIKDKNEKAEATMSTIISRLKKKFINNADTTVVLSVGGPKTHVEIKTDTELYGPVIANVLQPIEPERSFTKEELDAWLQEKPVR